jgi:hypothetical protein
MEQLSFLVQGSSTIPYRVVFTRRGGRISAKCSCPAGLKGQICKHRMSILSGSRQNVVSDNLNEIPAVISWLPGSDIEQAWSEVQRLEDDLNHLKIRLATAKKKLLKSMQESA